MGEDEIRDPAEEGVEGLKGIDKELYATSSAYRENIASGAKYSDETHAFYNGKARRVPDEIEYRTFADNPFQEMGQLYGLGQSKYDEEITNVSQLQDLEDSRAELQSTWAKWGAGLAKMGALAGTTILDNTIGMVWGLGDAVIHGDLNRFYNNSFSNWLREFESDMEKAMPNYRTAEERNRAWYENLGTANFWADTILKNAGFTIGTAVAAAATTALTGGVGGGALLSKGFGKLAQLFGKGVNATRNYQTGAKVGMDIWYSIGEAHSVASANYNDWIKEAKDEHHKTKNDSYKDLDAWYAEELRKIEETPEPKEGETPDGQQAIAISKEYRRQQLEDQYNARFNAINEEYDKNIDKSKEWARKAANADFLLESAFLMSTNLPGTLRGYKTSMLDAEKNVSVRNARRASRLAEEEAELRRAGRIDEANALRQKHKGNYYKGENFLTYHGKEMLSEGVLEEGGQGIIDDTVKDWYEKGYDEDERKHFADVVKLTFDNMVKTYGGAEGLQEVFAGAATAITGVTLPHRVRQEDGSYKWKIFQGGLFDSDAREDIKNSQETAKKLNETIKRIQGEKGGPASYMIRNATLESLKATAVEQGDIAKYKNAEFEQMCNDIFYYKTAGRLDDLKALVGNPKAEVTREEVENLAAMTDEKDANGDFITNCMRLRDSSGNSRIMSDDEFKQEADKIKKHRQEVWDTIDKISDAMDEIEIQSNGMFNTEQIKTLAWLKVFPQNLTDRVKNMDKDIKGNDVFDVITKELERRRDEAKKYYDIKKDENGEEVWEKKKGLSAKEAERLESNNWNFQNIKNLWNLLNKSALKQYKEGDRGNVIDVIDWGHKAMSLSSDGDIKETSLGQMLKDFLTQNVNNEQIDADEANKLLRSINDSIAANYYINKYRKQYNEYMKDEKGKLKLRAVCEAIEANVAKQDFNEAKKNMVSAIRSINKEYAKRLRSAKANNGQEAEKFAIINEYEGKISDLWNRYSAYGDEFNQRLMDSLESTDMADVSNFIKSRRAASNSSAMTRMLLGRNKNMSSLEKKLATALFSRDVSFSLQDTGKEEDDSLGLEYNFNNTEQFSASNTFKQLTKDRGIMSGVGSDGAYGSNAKGEAIDYLFGELNSEEQKELDDFINKNKYYLLSKVSDNLKTIDENGNVELTDEGNYELVEQAKRIMLSIAISRYQSTVNKLNEVYKNNDKWSTISADKHTIKELSDEIGLAKIWSHTERESNADNVSTPESWNVPFDINRQQKREGDENNVTSITSDSIERGVTIANEVAEMINNIIKGIQDSGGLENMIDTNVLDAVMIMDSVMNTDEVMSIIKEGKFISRDDFKKKEFFDRLLKTQSFSLTGTSSNPLYDLVKILSENVYNSQERSDRANIIADIITGIRTINSYREQLAGSVITEESNSILDEDVSSNKTSTSTLQEYIRENLEESISNADNLTKQMIKNPLTQEEVRIAAIKNLENGNGYTIGVADAANKQLSTKKINAVQNANNLVNNQRVVTEDDVQSNESDIKNENADVEAINKSNSVKAEEEAKLEEIARNQTTTLLPQTPQYSIKALMDNAYVRLADHMDMEEENQRVDPHETEDFLDKHGAFDFLNSGGLADWMADTKNPYHGQVYAMCDEDFNGGIAPENSNDSSGVSEKGIDYTIEDGSGNGIPCYYLYEGKNFVQHVSPNGNVYYTLANKEGSNLGNKIKKSESDGKNVKLKDAKEVDCVDTKGNKISGISGKDIIKSLRKTSQPSFFYAIRKASGEFQVIGMIPKLSKSILKNKANSKFLIAGIPLQNVLEIVSDRYDNLRAGETHDVPWQITKNAQNYHTTNANSKKSDRKIYGYDNLLEGYQAEAYMYYSNLSKKEQEEKDISVRKYEEDGKKYVEVTTTNEEGKKEVYVYEQKDMLDDNGKKVESADAKPYNIFFGDPKLTDIKRHQDRKLARGISNDPQKIEEENNARRKMFGVIKDILSKRFLKAEEGKLDNDSYIENTAEFTDKDGKKQIGVSRRYYKLDGYEIAGVHAGTYKTSGGEKRKVSELKGTLTDRSGNKMEASFEDMLNAGKVSIAVVAENKEKEKTMFFAGGQTRNINGSSLYKGAVVMEVANSAGGTDTIPLTIAKYSKNEFGNDKHINEVLQRAATELRKAVEEGANLDDKSKDNVLFKAWSIVNEAIYFPIGKDVHTGYNEGFSETSKFRINYDGAGNVTISFGEEQYAINVKDSDERTLSELKDCIEAANRPINVQMSIFKGKDRSSIADVVNRGYLKTSLESLNPVNTYFEFGSKSRDKSAAAEEKNRKIFKQKVSELKSSINSLSNVVQLTDKDFVPLNIGGNTMKVATVFRNGEHLIVDENMNVLSNEQIRNLVTTIGTSEIKDGKVSKVKIRLWFMISRISKALSNGAVNSFGTKNKETKTPEIGDRGIFRIATTAAPGSRYVCFDSYTGTIVSEEEMKERIADRAKEDGEQQPAEVDTQVPEKPVEVVEPKPEEQAVPIEHNAEPGEQHQTTDTVDGGEPKREEATPTPQEQSSNETDSNLNEMFSDDEEEEEEGENDGETMREETDEYEETDIDDEVKWLGKVLPQFTLGERVFVVDHIDVAGKKGAKAWGMLKDNCIYLANNMSRGTAYHEAYHAVSLLMLSKEERENMYDEVRKMNGNVNWSNKDCEEELAEMFRKYVQARELGNTQGLGRILAWFKSLFQKLRLMSKYPSVANKLFDKINSGKFANAKENDKVNKFNKDAIDKSKVDVVEQDKPWKNNPNKSNKTIRLYLKDQHDKGYFEVVKDEEYGYFSVHFKTATDNTAASEFNAENTSVSTKEERAILFEQMLNAIPDGAKFSTWGTLSPSGERAVKKLGMMAGNNIVGYRDVEYKKNGGKFKLPIYQKGDSEQYRETPQNIDSVVDSYNNSDVRSNGSMADYMSYIEDKTNGSTTKGVAYATDYVDNDGKTIIVQTNDSAFSESMNSMVMGDICREIGVDTSVDIDGVRYDRKCKPCIVNSSEQAVRMGGKYSGVTYVLTGSKPQILGSEKDVNTFSEYVKTKNKKSSRSAYDKNPSGFASRGISRDDFDKMPDIAKDKLSECV